MRTKCSKHLRAEKDHITIAAQAEAQAKYRICKSHREFHQSLRESREGTSADADAQ